MKVNPTKLKAAIIAREKNLCDFAQRIRVPSGVITNALRYGHLGFGAIRRIAAGLGVSVESLLEVVSYD